MPELQGCRLSIHAAEDGLASEDIQIFDNDASHLYSPYHPEFNSLRSEGAGPAKSSLGSRVYPRTDPCIRVGRPVTSAIEIVRALHGARDISRF